MMRKLTLALCLLFMANSVHAALLARLGGQAYYDTVLDVTWLANSNLAATNTFGVGGIQVDGRMDQATAFSWIAGMNAANYLGFNDWRLPEILPIDGSSYDEVPSFDGSTDIGYNVTAPGSAHPGSTQAEMAHLHYNTLANAGLFTTAGLFSGCGGPTLCLTNEGPFSIEAFYYWSGLVIVPDPTIGGAFHFGTGQQITNPVTDEYFAWAVRSGDTAPVPVPAAVPLFVSGLALLAGMARRRASKV